MNTLSAEKIVIAEKLPYLVDEDYTLIPPALFRALVDAEYTIQYDEVYLDVDTVPEDLLAIALACFDNDKLFAYSRRWEEKLLRSGSDKELFESMELGYVKKDENDVTFCLVFRCAGDRVMERSKLFGRKLFRAGQFGFKHFFPGIKGDESSQVKVQKRFSLDVLGQNSLDRSGLAHSNLDNGSLTSASQGESEPIESSRLS